MKEDKTPKPCINAETGKRCNNWSDCTGHVWYNYFEIQWCIHQNVWIIKNLSEMLTGHWPDEVILDKDEKNRPKAPSLGELPTVSGGEPGNASYELACSIAGEVEERIKTLPFKHRTLLTTWCREHYPNDDDSVMRELDKRQSPWRTQEIVWSSLYKISGWRR